MNHKNSSSLHTMDDQRAQSPLGRAELKALLGTGVGLLSLPASLEHLFQQAHQQFALSVVKVTLPIALVSVLFIVLFTMLFFSAIPPMLWGLGAVIVVAFTLVIVSAHVQGFNRWLTHSMGLGGLMCIMAMHVAVGNISEPALSTAAQFGVAYITIAVFNMTNMLVRSAFAWVFASLVLVIVLEYFALLAVDYQAFLYYAVSSAIIGIALGVVQELRERRLFVQGHLLALENEELDALTRELDELSRRDALTGLFNRRCFNEILQEEWNRCLRNNEPLSLLYLDVDHFKRYNDFYGHQQGDRCLVMVAGTLSRLVLRSGDVVARYGGEEFVALFPRASSDGAGRIAEKIIAEVDALALPHVRSLTADTVTLSIGVATLVPDRESSPDLLLQRADAALYAAKEAGRHCYRLA